MKKLFTLIASAACVFAASADNPVFSIDFKTATADDFAAWTVVDANADEKTWTFNEEGSPSRVFYSYSGTNAGDDWLISPAVTIPADGTYVLSYQFAGSSYGESFDVWVGNTPTVEGMTEKIAEHSGVGSDETGSLAFADLKAGTMHFAFHCTTEPDKFRLYITTASLQEASNPVDLRVSGITSPVTGEGLGQEKVTVLVSNNGRVEVSSYDVAYSLNDGEPVIEHVDVPLGIGETKEYTFSTPADLSIGHYTHLLKAWTIHESDLNPANDSFETKVKHIAPAAVPYRMGFEPDEDTSLMTFLNLNEDDGDWGINIGGGWFGNFARTDYGCLAYNYNKENAADDWAFLEPIQMEEGYYVLKFWYSATENHKDKMRLYYGSAPTPEAMTNLLHDYDCIDNDKYAEAIHIFQVENPGPVYIGFYCYSDADENWLVIDDLSIDQVDPEKFDLAIINPVSPTTVMRDGSLTDITFSLQNVGIIDAEVTVNAYLDGERVAEGVRTVKGQEILPVTFEKALEGITPGKHSLKIEAHCEGDYNLDNNILEREIAVMDQAIKLWDFEDGQLPADLTLRKEDYGTNHPDAGDEFNEDGFGIFNLEHMLLGQHALAVNTWFTDGTTADRWIVLPQLSVTGDNAYFVWNANSYNPTHREKYEVRVSTTEDNWYSYTTVMTVPSEEINVQTRGISLADYKDKTIYVAIHVRTYDGEALIVDNLGIYGDIVLGTVGVESVADNLFRVSVENDMLNVYGAEKPQTAVYDLNGRLMLRSNTENTDLSILPDGAYVAKVSTENSVKTVKFMR